MKKTAILLLLIFCFSLLPIASAAAEGSTYEDYAECLSKLDVFVGTGNGFELNRAPTRIEGLVMLTRLLGAEEEAKAMQGNALPFTDVPKWAAGYVAYAYENGLTNGIGKTKFGSSDKMDAKAYMTFLLRSLGYNDQAGDFSYNNSLIFAESIQLINDTTYSTLKAKPFIRAYIAKTSYGALKFPYKGSDTLLVDKLMAEDKVDKTTGDAFKRTVLSEPSELNVQSTSPIDVAANMSSVVMLSCYTDYTDEEYGPDIGSGVILTADGKIVTNYHVVEGAKKIEITFNDESVYTGSVIVTGYDKDLDLAVLKIDKTGLKPATVGDSSKVKTGDLVITIGSPFGLINTVTEGIVSAIRSDTIQIDAAINPGNSGGGMFDEDGKLIGIPNSGIFYADNMGFAIPINELTSVLENKNMQLKDFYAMTREPLPPGPTGLCLVYETGTTALLNWNPVANAEDYNIYCKSEDDEDYEFLDTGYCGTGYSYLSTELEPGKEYSFKVSSNVDYQESELSSALTFKKSFGNYKPGSFDLFYTAYPKVPDFGKLAGVSPFRNESDVLYYRILASECDSPVITSDYILVLEDCGFTFVSANQTADGTITNRYTNTALDQDVAITAKLGADELWINIEIEK